jgi:hypothetical protein
MNQRRINQKEYDELFKNDEVQKEALKQAYEVRKFEIELYWKRAAYFWTFIGASFVGYAALFNSASHNKEHGLVLISCIGLVFSVAWHCVNKGSKFWQENWENHVELMEDKVFGPLYKSITMRPRNFENWKEKVQAFLVAPEPFSVSKINQLVSTYVAIIWCLLLLYANGEICISYDVSWPKLIPIVISLVTCASFWLTGKSHQGMHHPEVYIRKTDVNNPVNPRRRNP